MDVHTPEHKHQNCSLDLYRSADAPVNILLHFMVHVQRNWIKYSDRVVCRVKFSSLKHVIPGMKMCTGK